MTNEKEMKNYERRPPLELPGSDLVGIWSFVLRHFATCWRISDFWSARS
jgi:hypothetical protein